MPPPGFLQDRARRWTRQPAALPLGLGAVFLLAGLGWAPLLDWDENIYAEVARQIVRRGEWLALTINGQPFVEKPPLFLWELALSFRLLGVSEVAARLPSALNGLAFLALLLWLGRRLADGAVGWFWALLYLAALIPLAFARSAVIDHTFNALMGAAAFLLLLYDEAYGEWREGRRGPARHRALLTAAALSLGLAVLAKGPVGGVVPLVAFGAAKLVRRRPPISLPHVLACGALSLGIVAAWLGANALVAGDTFLRRFAEFQGLLVSRPLEDHTGPVYYHVAMGLLGFFPWSPLLLLYALKDVRRPLWAEPRSRTLIALALGWIAFVLAVFSAVQTKLPHYSSSMYLPLALLVALALGELLRRKAPVPRWIAGLFAAYGVALGAGVAAVPYLADRLARQAGIALDPPPAPGPLAYAPGVLLALGVALGGGWLAQGALRRAVVAGVVAMGLFMLGAWRVHLPLVAAYNQGPVLALMREAYAAGGDLALYRNVSFAVLFYGGREVEMLHSYKFRGNPARLDEPGLRDMYVITPRRDAPRLLREHPKLRPVRELGRLALYRLPARPR
ncbi:MAG: glycosyltransferase family 39 protein [Candidatus Lambdaproteobacteria bacterium]|nr:glycosyltransferase family 39 protein [Candidatus Lambdaproteobacteria bacterium]